MENKGLLAGLVAIAVVALSALAFISLKSPSVIVTGGGNTPSIVSVGGNDSEEQRYGGTTNLDTLGLTGDLSVGGALTLTGTSTFNGAVSGNAVPTSKVVSFTSVSSTGSLCSILNDTGSDRVLSAVDLVYTTTTQTALGFSYFTISQSATAAATGTGANLYFSNDRLAVSTNGLLAVTPTSTIAGFGDGLSAVGPVRAIWRANSYINFLTGVPNTLFTGTCRVVSH